MRWKDSLSALGSLTLMPALVTAYVMYPYSLGWLAVGGVFAVAVALNIVWLVLWEAWYEQGKFFNVIRYPKALSVPTWTITQTCRLLRVFAPGHPLNKPISLQRWNRYSTAVTRRFDLAFLVLGVAFWTAVYMAVRLWRS